MKRSSNPRKQAACAAGMLLAAGAASADFDSGPQMLPMPKTFVGRLPEGAHDEIIVTAQRREESAQRVPIALSAFSQSDLDNAGVQGGPDLQLAVPNTTFSKDAFFGNNFQIRGIGTQIVNTTADPATGVHVNQAPLLSSDLFDGQFFDLERVEVLRGPQGTLYGRNATGGVVNLVTAQPTGRLEGQGEVEVGNASSDKVQGWVNIPVHGDQLGVRLAGLMASRGGLLRNQTNGDHVDGREMTAGRATIAFNPSDRLNSYFIWQHFSENDSRARFSKTLCTPDPGATVVGGVLVDPVDQNFLSQGCKATSIYGADVFGAPNTVATLPGLLALRTGIVGGNTNAGLMQTPDFRSLDMWRDPSYQARDDLAELNVTYRLTDFLELTTLESYATQNTVSRTFTPVPSVPFLNTPLTPGGVFTDPQIGASNLPLSSEIEKSSSNQYTAELRLQSLLLGRFNFSVGANYLHYSNTTNAFGLSNELTAAALALNNGAPCPLALSNNCIFIDPSPEPTGNGHNYFDQITPYTLRSEAAFGEIYYHLLPNLKLTAGVRYTRDVKDEANIPNVLLLATNAAAGRQPGFPPVVRLSSNQPTGRLGVDWQPDLPFTDRTLVYGFYSRGYQGGGINFNAVVNTAAVPAFLPEIIDSFEIGAKNSLLADRLLLNLTAFHYTYHNYQTTNIVNRAAVIQNVDARASGLELESAWKVTQSLRLGLTAGLLDTAVTRGSSMDPFNITGGNPALTLVKNPLDASNCVAPTNGVALIQSMINSHVLTPGALLGVCTGAFQALGVTPMDGSPMDLKGKRLPNAPQWTASLEAAYSYPILPGWTTTLRADVYARGTSYARIYNTTADLIRGWSNTNAEIEVASARWNLEIALYGHNLFDQRQVTSTSLSDPAQGLVRDVFLLDPRVYGLLLRKRF